MGIVKDFYIEFFEPKVDSEEGQRHVEEERRREAHFWEVTCEACPIDTREMDLLVKEKCSRAAKIMAAKRGRESRS